MRLVLNRRVGALVAAFVVAFAMLSVTSPAAKATHNSNGCSGTLLLHKPVKNDAGTTIAHLDVYYGGGWNCAYLRKSGPAYGVNGAMRVTITRCKETTQSSTCTADGGDVDNGNYSYYAGPVTVYAPNNCI